MANRSLTIGEVAKTTGVPARTIRYYEEIGVLPTPDRAISGYRQYDDLAVERLRFIGRARSLGLPLQRLRILTSALNGKPRAAPHPRLLCLVQGQLSAVRHQIADLVVLREQLEGVFRQMLSCFGTPRVPTIGGKLRGTRGFCPFDVVPDEHQPGSKATQ